MIPVRAQPSQPEAAASSTNPEQALVMHPKKCGTKIHAAPYHPSERERETALLGMENL
jgi:hypothetical protein